MFLIGPSYTKALPGHCPDEVTQVTPPLDSEGGGRRDLACVYRAQVNRLFRDNTALTSYTPDGPRRFGPSGLGPTRKRVPSTVSRGFPLSF